MLSELISRRDLDFLLWDWLGAERLFARPRFADHSRETTGALLDVAEGLARDAFLSHYKAADRAEPTLGPEGVHVLPEVRQAVTAFADAGFLALPADAALGGLQAPYVVYCAAMSFFQAANTATAGYPMLSVGNAHLLAKFGTPAQVAAFVAPQVRGEMLGTMCLSEPQAGSSLGDIVTRAEPDGEDALGQRYRLSGTKMWISAGDHDITPNIVHLVLAKAQAAGQPPAAGTKGISLFIVPKWLASPADAAGERNDVVVAGLNHKMGYRGTSNCVLNFGEGRAHRPGGRPGAVGYLVGQPGQGLAQMFHMMNEARIGVGLSGAALGYRGYRLSLAYARERTQGRPAGSAATEPPQPIIEHPDVRRMLLAQKAYAEGALALVLYAAALVDEAETARDEDARDTATDLLALLTPIAKAWPSEWGLAANDLAIQVHGGYGYTRDFDVEQLYRDNRLNAIHEGTTGIQALDLLGRKILRDRGAGLALVSGRVGRTIEAAKDHPETGALTVRLAATLEQLQATAVSLADAGDEALWDATPFLRAFGHLVVGWLWLDQALAALDRAPSDPLREGKLRACRYFHDYELPMVQVWLDIVRACGGVAATMPAEAF